MKGVTTFDEIVVVGSRGTSVMIVDDLRGQWKERVRVRAVLDEIENGYVHPTFGVPVVSRRERREHYADVPLLVTVSDPGLRKRMSQDLDAEGATFATVTHTDFCHVDRGLQVGPGTVCAPYARLGPNVRAGAGTLILSSMVAHDVEIGDYSWLGLQSLVLGHVHIGEGVTVAPGAIISNGTARHPRRIGAGAVIGVGAVVLEDVAPGARLIGNPAMTLREWVKLRRLLDAP